MTPNLSHWDVLVVDDELDNIGVVSFVLEYHEAHYRTAASGEECLEMIRVKRPTLILLDIQMPKMSGWDVLKVIRDDPTMANLAVIAVTAHAMVGDRQRAVEAGFDGYITKPISPLTIIQEIEAILAEKEMRISK